MSNERVLSLTRTYVPIAFGLLMLAAAIVSRFAVLSNDSFPLLWQTKHLLLSDPPSFYNGFFPIGYPLLMRLAAIMHEPLTTLEIVQVVLAPVYVLCVVALFAKFLKPKAILLGVLVVVAYPDFLRCVLSATPDFLTSLATVVGFYAIIKERYTLAGALLGLALLFRAHILGLVVAVVIAIIALQKTGKVRPATRFVAGVLPFFVVQGIAQVWSGHGFFESAQAFNIYRVMYGVDWTAPPHVTASVFELILHDPSTFVQAYFIDIAESALVLIPVSLVLLFNRRHRQPHAVLVLCFSTLIYILIVTIGFSPRSILPVWPIGALAMMILFQRVSDRLTLSPRALNPAIILIAVAIAITVILAAIRSGERVEEYDQIARLLNLRSESDASGVYSDDFALYFPSLRDATPKISGGWAEIGLPEYPKFTLKLDDANALRTSLGQAHSNAIVLRLPPINERAHSLVVSDSLNFALISRTATHAIYRVR